MSFSLIFREAITNHVLRDKRHHPTVDSSSIPCHLQHGSEARLKSDSDLASLTSAEFSEGTVVLTVHCLHRATRNTGLLAVAQFSRAWAIQTTVSTSLQLSLTLALQSHAEDGKIHKTESWDTKAWPTSCWDGPETLAAGSRNPPNIEGFLKLILTGAKAVQARVQVPQYRAGTTMSGPELACCYSLSNSAVF